MRLIVDNSQILGSFTDSSVLIEYLGYPMLWVPKTTSIHRELGHIRQSLS